MRLFVLIFMLGATKEIHALDLEYIRKNYSNAVNDEDLCRSFIDKLSKNAETNVHLAYLGAFQTIWANHVFNPASKLSTFNKGRSAIETALMKEPDNIEIRFIRFSVQKNCPSLLGYSSNIAADKKFLTDNLAKITSAQLKKMVKSLIE
jgi:hypothetical protein